jgi:hypothetical protein
MTARVGLVGATSVMLVTAVAGVAGARSTEVPPRTFARTVCGVYVKVPKVISAYTKEYDALPTQDPAAFKSAVVSSASKLLGDLDKLRAKVGAQFPSVDSGRNISKVFVTDIQEYIDRGSKALAKLKAADAAAPDFQGVVSKYEAAIAALGAPTPADPFRKVHDQDVVKALGAEKSCGAIVKVTRTSS